MWRLREAKYRSRKTEYNGVEYDSKGEAGLAMELDLRLRAGNLKSVRRQVTFDLLGPGRRNIVAKHRVDFLLTYPDGSQEVCEFKGPETEGWRIKHALFLDNYPAIPYTIVKAKPRWKARRRRSLPRGGR